MRLTVAQALVRFLAMQEVERDGVQRPFFAGCLGILGHGNIAGLGQALQQERDGLRFHQARNEQSMVHIATGYARQTNRLGALACTTSVGPGATNLVTGAALATINRLPVLLLAGDTFAGRRPHPVLQQLEREDDGTVSVNDTLRPVSRYFDRINRPEQLFSAALEAMRVLTDPENTGAVTLALPMDVQTEALDVPDEFLARRCWRIERRPPERTALATALELLADAERPLVVAGGGARYSEASRALARFADLFGCPVCETQSGRGALASAHPLSVGAIGATGTAAANALAAEADVVLGVGTRWSDFTTASKTVFQHPSVRFVNLNVSRFDAVKLGGLPLIADARAGLEALAAAPGAPGRPTGTWTERAERLRSDWLVERERICEDHGASPVSQPALIAAVNEAAGELGTVVCAAGSMPGELHRLWLASGPAAYHVEYGYSCMGYEVPGAVGAKLAAPERDVYALVGDGSWLMLNGELVTAVARRLKIVVVLVDNQGYSSIGSLSRSLGQGGFGTVLASAEESEPLDPPAAPAPPLELDLARTAEGLGAHVERAPTISELRAALHRARSIDGPVVIWVPADRMASAPSFGWWDVPVAEVADDDSIGQARVGYERERELQRDFLGGA